MRAHASWGRVIGAIVVAIVLLSLGAWLLLGAADPEVDVPFEVARAILNLIGALIIAGILAAVLARVAADRSAREEAHRSLTVTLQELKAAYERVQVARFHLQARTTPLTLVQQLPTFMEARALLHRVQRDRFVLGTTVEHHVQDMLDYITLIANEYRHNAVSVTQAALEEEALMQRIRDGEKAAIGDCPRLKTSSFPTTTAMLLEEPTDLQLPGTAPWKNQPFHVNYRAARRFLQASMDAVAPRDAQ